MKTNWFGQESIVISLNFVYDSPMRRMNHTRHKSNKDPSFKQDPTHSEDGVDLTLIRWMISLTPTERLETLQKNIRSIMRLRSDQPSA